MKRTIALLLTFCIMLTLISVISVNARNNVYSYNSKTKTLTINIKGKMKYNCENAPWKDIKNPEHIVLKKGITSISVRGFSGTPSQSESYWNYNHKIKTVKLPNTLKVIDDYAFAFCTSLEKVNIPKSVKSIGWRSFTESELKTITIPPKVKIISSSAFANCNSLKSVTLKKGVKLIDGGAFDECGSLSKVKIPNSVTEISYGAFDNCKRLKEVTLPKSVKKIGKSAFGYKDKKTKHIRVKGFTIKGYKGTAAEKYAKNNGFKFVALG